MTEPKNAFFVGIVEGFLRGNIPVLIIIASLIAGAGALMVTPREEEPQITVPLADILISYPGGSAEQVERLVASRLERLLYQVEGVEYVYSMSQPGAAIVTVRFYVGQNRDTSFFRLYNQLSQNLDLVTPGIAGWLVKPVEIDDVPIISAALYSKEMDTHALYRIAEEVVGKLQRTQDSARITIHGGEPRQITAYLDPERLAAFGLSISSLQQVIQAANVNLVAGTFEQANRMVTVEAGPFLQTADDLSALMVGVHGDKPVYFRDLADIIDGPAEPTNISRFSTGPADSHIVRDASAVTIAVAKKRGSNAVRVARDVQSELHRLQQSMLPANVGIRITRDYGETANDKVNDLVGSLALAILTVIGLLAFTMNWRAGLIVAMAVPITYSLTLLCNLLLGYTINRVTLFALILALGLLVDDPIAGVENIERHFKMGNAPRHRAVINAMREIMTPVLLSTIAIIIAFTPMFFITGMMGPYMQPMAMNVPLAVVMSTVTALTVTPWLALKLLPKYATKAGNAIDEDERIRRSTLYKIYAGIVSPFIDSHKRARVMLGIVSALFASAVALALTGFVPLKMLPFDNKNEFQILVDMPEGTTLEATDAAVRSVEAYLHSIPEVLDFTSLSGAASPMDFNGMVRHYYMRQAPHLGDIRVNLVHRTRRKDDSHTIMLRIRNDIAGIARQTGASLKLVAIPPGPPVLATLVAEVYGPPQSEYAELIAAARTVKTRFTEEPGVVDLDSTIEAPQEKLTFITDRDKAGRSGIHTVTIADTLRVALTGEQIGILETRQERNELAIALRLPRQLRSSSTLLANLPVASQQGHTVRLGELGTFTRSTVDQTIYRKNQERVVYVMSEVAGRGPAYAVLNLQSHFKRNPLPEGFRINWSGEGEWKITLDVFRDLGIAFSIALLGIYVLLVYETGSFLLPVVIMLSIPLTMIGIMPGFWLLNLVVNRPVDGFDNPVFFTATAMIGMIALSGIVVRNAIVLIDFIGQARERGEDLRAAILASGSVRMRPILLTAGTTLLGAWPITFDPIFSGLAWSIIFGLLVSTAFTLVVVPVVYFMIFTKAATKNSKMEEG
jgi:multidrug efflux pump subunit AcrB